MVIRESLAQHFHLVDAVCPSGAFVHFLKHDDVGIVPAYFRYDAFDVGQSPFTAGTYLSAAVVEEVHVIAQSAVTDVPAEYGDGVRQGIWAAFGSLSVVAGSWGIGRGNDGTVLQHLPVGGTVISDYSSQQEHQESGRHCSQNIKQNMHCASHFHLSSGKKKEG